MADDDIKIYDIWRDSSQRFDYFVTGLVGALVAFIGQSFIPQRIGLNPGTLELLALLILILSFWSGFKRIECNTEALRLMFQRNQSEDKLRRLRDIVESGQLARDNQTGKIMSSVETNELIEATKFSYGHSDKYVSIWTYKSLRYYQLRNYFLISGFILLLISRILKAYLCAP